MSKLFKLSYKHYHMSLYKHIYNHVAVDAKNFLFADFLGLSQKAVSSVYTELCEEQKINIE